MKGSTLLLSLLIVVASVASVIAQSTSTTGTGETTTSAGSEVQKTLEEILEEPTTTDTYRYDPQGRRDPFRSLIGPAVRPAPGQRPEGVPGFLIEEIKLQGIFRTKQGLTGLIGGPDNIGYLIKVGDKLLDGEVIRITPTSVVLRQEVNDPTRIERYREVVIDLAPPASTGR
jgi:Tfp pilus assembly protein PilP